MYISEFAISGYRSLKDIEIRDMLPVCIFHGPNNSGKSNILSAMETIFRRKLLVEETTIEKTTQHTRTGGFWRGRISNFRDNFYLNERNDIRFSVSVAFKHEELVFLKDVLKHPPLAKPTHKKILKLSGRIAYVDENSADMILEQAVLNNAYIVFETAGSEKRFFPALEDVDADRRFAYFEHLMNLLADSFAVVSADRYLTEEALPKQSESPIVLNSKTFKGWLFDLSLSRRGYQIFEDIKAMFAAAPFAIGEVGFSRTADEIEIMVKEKNIRLPIGRLGSGYQQILFIVANLVLNKHKLLGIEELEINLSPKLQQVLFEKIKTHVHRDSDLASQVIITSHSDYFSKRMDVRCYGVEHNGAHTVVAKWTAAREKEFFSR